MRGIFGRFAVPGDGNNDENYGRMIFQASYRAYPVTFIDRGALEVGDKVILPPSALDRISRAQIDEFPMSFSATNAKENKKTHCGVLEFVADEGVVYMPYWMMQNLLLGEGDVVKFAYAASMPKGTYVKLRAQTSDFLDISNPKAVLETTLRHFTCLTVGDTFVIHYNDKKYHIDVVEAKPGNAISVVDTDCEVDFAPPLDYVDPYGPDNTKFADTKSGVVNPGIAAAKKTKVSEVSTAPTASTSADATGEAVGAPKTFLAFASGGRRLDGKAITEIAPKEVEIPTTSLNVTKEWQALRQGGVLGGETSKEAEKPNPDADIDRKRSGKVVFGGARQAAIARKKEKSKAEDAADPLKAGNSPQPSSFEAFKGSGNKLR